tara:strand:- start:95 stop:1519 length:1425 start_codon:yes stop_codon:yes gene_type:complete
VRVNALNYVFYDLETTGRNSAWDQIIQVAAVLTDDKFNIIDRFEERCRLKKGLVPHPEALIVNKTSVDMLNKLNLSHYELTKKIEKKFKMWSPAIFIGYNSINFDEEFIRKTFFKNLFEPYLTQFSGNKRADIINITRTSKFYYPESLKVGVNEKGNQVFKLDVLTELNNIVHNAHDAMGDVNATIEISKILQERADKVWNAGLKNNNKIDVDNFLIQNNIVCIDEYLFGKFNVHAVTYVCKNQFNYPQCFDLLHDPIEYIDMSIKDLKVKMKQKPKLIKEIKNNKNPILLDSSFLYKMSTYKKIGMEVLIKRAEIIKNSADFKEKIQTILFEEYESKQMTNSQIDIMPEESIYSGGFPDNSEKSRMIDFHNADWEKKFYIANQFEDERYKYFGYRLIYEEMPHILPKLDYENIHKIIANQILSTDNEKWNTIPKSYHELDNLREEYERQGDDEKLLFLENWDHFLQDLEKQYQ